MIHVAVLGSIERFMGVLIEHTAGNLPVWLSPVQILLAPVSAEKHSAGAHQLAAQWRAAGVRVSVDDANETVGNRVRKAVGQKVPYIVVVGDREIAGEELSVRLRGVEEPLKIAQTAFLSRVCSEIQNRKAA
jgi:threonyl-tRNA synthetase